MTSVEGALAWIALVAVALAWARVLVLSRTVERLRRAPAPVEDVRVPAAPPAAGEDDVLRRRVEDLEARCLALESRPSAVEPPSPPPEEVDASPVEALRRHLHDRGFEDVRVQGEGNPRSPLRVEAVRQGTVYKGRVDAGAPGSLEERLEPARRAFP
jgi:hypothetical protein